MEKGVIEGKNPVHDLELAAYDISFEESCWSGFQHKMGGKSHLKLNIGERPIANK